MSDKNLRFITTADLHFGGSASGLPEERIGRSPTETWRLLVKCCISMKADVLLVAGDLIDKEADFERVNEELGFGFSALGKYGIDVVLITGNHDYDLIPLLLKIQTIKNLRLLGVEGHWEIIKMEKKGIRFSIAGRSFPETAQESDPLKGADVVLKDAGYPTIGMLHCDTKNAESIFGYVEKERLQELPVDVWLLGHLHEAEIIHINPLIFYPGKPGIRTSSNESHGFVKLELSNGRFENPEWLNITETAQNRFF